MASRSGFTRPAAQIIPDYLDEKKSLYEIWWAFGWSYETAAPAARLVFSKTLDKYPNLKIILHHFGGIIPMLEGRIGPGWDQLGARTSDEDYGALRKSLKKRPLDYFQQDFYVDSAAFGGAARPCAAWNSIRATKSFSPPTARSIRKKVPDIFARR